MDSKETFELAFTEPPGNLAGLPIEHLSLPTPHVSWGLTYEESCAKHLEHTFHASRVYIIASGSLARNTDRVDRLIKAIGESKVVGVRNGITPHTPWSEILSIAAECRAANADSVVTLGAGSITDGAKIVLLCLANDITEPSQLARYSIESTEIPANVKEPTIPLINIPTTLSGGEYFSTGGGTEDSTHHKHGFIHSGMGSRLVILDAELSTLTPEYHWLSTGVRSIDHCVEALCSLGSTAKSDEYAENGLRMIVPSLMKCKKDPQDIPARHKCQLAARFAMANLRAGIPLGGSHAIGHQLGPLGVPHGITSCIMSPAVMEYNIKYGSENPQIKARQDKVRDILWSEPEVAAALREAGLSDMSSLGQLLDAIIRALGLPRSLHEVQVGRDIFPALSKGALRDFWSPTNPVPLLREEQVQEILEAVA
ncbi:Dehydroquinate synthase-like protein [Penicillium vulpinum]|uniref:Uncharacterized protein n=1 Tax=Penicillium vulpinum TaxID=29845 RepID=A0A1V6S8A0_9EURO|nr:Dehydroquinate synthase-like protein [Penicillium vulpinum]KAJ5952164.1 Dehydroquinate synthase-like protein [Penicillium vulpinum]OQE10261.1 hypothetical protein PENVUL_c004G05882 [Penicillium vulpinum]